MTDPKGTAEQGELVQTEGKGQDQEQKQEQEQQKAGGFEAWLAGAPEDVKVLYQAHLSGLLNTVKATREEREAARTERDALKVQVKDLLSKAEKGSVLESQLQETLVRLDESEKRASFLEEAAKPSVGCHNPKLAYVLAVSEGLFNKSGAPDWVAIREHAPELFAPVVPPGKAGTGTTDRVPDKADMNMAIRRMAGR